MAVGGAAAGQGYHVVLHTPGAFTAPVDYHPTVLLTGADGGYGAWYPAGSLAPGGAGEFGDGHSVCTPDGSGRTMPDQRHLVPGSRSPITFAEGHSDGLPLTGRGPDGAELTDIAGLDFDTPPTPARPRVAGDDPAVRNYAYTWHVPEYVRISGERCSHRPWNPAGTGLATAVRDVLESATLAPGSHLKDLGSSAVGQPVVVRQFTPGPPSRSAASVHNAGAGRRLPTPAAASASASASASAEPTPEPRQALTGTGFSVARYAAGGALLLVAIVGVLAHRRRAQH